MKTLSFSKYTGCGNDFILIDQTQPLFSLSTQEIAHLCHRRYGIGADGLIFLEKSACAQFKMRYFNADGLEANLCGNGVRCLALFAKKLGFRKPSFLLETKAGLLQVVYENDLVTFFQPFPQNPLFKQKITLENTTYFFDFLDTGVPHIVLFTTNCEDFPLSKLGPLLCHHPHFLPHQTNVNIASFPSKRKIRMRTFERGVNEETLACGTGALAVAFSAKHQFNIPSPITLLTSSQEKLTVCFDDLNEQLSLTGQATFVFEGKISL